MKITIYDPAMCCPTGVCGPSVDPDLVRVAVAINNLQEQNIDVTRYNLAFEPFAFTENETVNKMLMEQGTDFLPLTIIDGEVVKEKAYLSNEEFEKITGISAEKLGQKTKIRLRDKNVKVAE